MASDDVERERRPTRSFLDLLSDDALGEVGRVLNAPQQIGAVCNVASFGKRRDGFFDSDPVVARTRCFQFTTLSVWPGVPVVENGDVLEEVYIDMHFDDVRPRKLADSRLDLVRRLVVEEGVKGDAPPQPLPHSQCSRMKQSIDVIFEERGTQLTELAVMRNTEQTFEFADHMARWAMCCPALKSFEHSGPDMQHMFPLWSKVGATLEKVHLHCWKTEHWPVTLDLIAHHCRQLVDITLLDPTDNNAVSSHEFASFLAGYGKQLCRVCLYHVEADGRIFFINLPPEAYRHVVSSCPHVRISYFEDDQQFASVAALGSNLDTLAFDLVQPSNWLSLSSAMWHCSSLVSLRVFEMRNDMVMRKDAWMSLLAAPLPSLESIALPTVDNPVGLLQCITERTGNLLSFEFSCTVMKSGAMFASLVRSNPRLRKVYVAETKIPPDRVTEDDVLSFVTGVLSVFWRCRGLEKFRIGLQSDMPSEASMRNMFVPFRYRGIELQSDFGDDCVTVFHSTRTGLKIFDNIGMTSPVFEMRDL